MLISAPAATSTSRLSTAALPAARPAPSLSRRTGGLALRGSAGRGSRSLGPAGDSAGRRTVGPLPTLARIN